VAAATRSQPYPPAVPSNAGIGIVLPVRDAERDIDACLATIVPQARAVGAAVIVVDDGSHDGSAEIARASGATVIVLDGGSGPYAARNVGWRALPPDVEVVVFTDVRNRAQPGWLDGLTNPLEDARVAITGGNVRMGGDQRLAHRLARAIDVLNVEDRLRSEWLPYVATASMAVRRAVLEEVGGFREVRSAGDVDLCWRVQLAGLGEVVAAPDSEMVCVPRSRVREVMRQWSRWGRSNAEVRARFSDDGCPSAPPVALGAWAVGSAVALGGAVRHRRWDLPVLVLDRARMLAYSIAYRRAWRDAVRDGALSSQP
jgi:glycosyltransferase involved in cell wall biosynthesis